jgi:hypothetical protein
MLPVRFGSGAIAPASDQEHGSPEDTSRISIPVPMSWDLRFETSLARDLSGAILCRGDKSEGSELRQTDQHAPSQPEIRRPKLAPRSHFQISVAKKIRPSPQSQAMARMFLQSGSSLRRDEPIAHRPSIERLRSELPDFGVWGR